MSSVKIFFESFLTGRVNGRDIKVKYSVGCVARDQRGGLRVRFELIKLLFVIGVFCNYQGIMVNHCQNNVEIRDSQSYFRKVLIEECAVTLLTNFGLL